MHSSKDEIFYDRLSQYDPKVTGVRISKIEKNYLFTQDAKNFLQAMLKLFSVDIQICFKLALTLKQYRLLLIKMQ